VGRAKCLPTCEYPACDGRSHIELSRATVHESGQGVARDAARVTGDSDVEDTRIDLDGVEGGEGVRGWM
jgi:hypothetical protein